MATSEAPVTQALNSAAPADENARHRAQINDRLAWVQKQRTDLARTARRVPRLLVVALAAVPAGLVWGPIAVLLVLGFAAALPLMAGYIVWCHRQEYAAEYIELSRQLENPVPAGGSRPRGQPWRVPGKPLYL